MTNPNTLIGKPCVLTEPRCKGQIAIAEEVRPLGMRMKGVGIVPHGEYRLATDNEWKAWQERQ